MTDAGRDVVAVGTDVVAVARIAKLIEQRGRVFLQRWFTPDEIAACSARATPAVHFAAHFAAKEAAFKALPGRWDGPVPWRDIEIRQANPGQASVTLSGAVETLAAQAGIGRILVSFTRTATHAIAVAVAQRA